jgi:Leucine-rich repeat (LRR) protein
MYSKCVSSWLEIRPDVRQCKHKLYRSCTLVDIHQYNNEGNMLAEPLHSFQQRHDFTDVCQALLAKTLMPNNARPCRAPQSSRNTSRLVFCVCHSRIAALRSSIPELWAGMSSLQHLDLSATNISGQLPEALAALQQLQVLRTSNTQLSGQLPAAYGILGSLQEMDLSNARLTGPMPGAWADASMLRRVATDQLQQAQQRLQQASGGKSPRLTNPDADVQRAAAQMALLNIERALDKLNKAPDVQASANGDMGLYELRVLRLNGNRLSGTLPGTLSQLAQLQEVNLARNRLGGTLPVQLAALQNLQVGGIVHVHGVQK